MKPRAVFNFFLFVCFGTTNNVNFHFDVRFMQMKPRAVFNLLAEHCVLLTVPMSMRYGPNHYALILSIFVFYSVVKSGIYGVHLTNLSILLFSIQILTDAALLKRQKKEIEELRSKLKVSKLFSISLLKVSLLFLLRVKYQLFYYRLLTLTIQKKRFLTYATPC